MVGFRVHRVVMPRPRLPGMRLRSSSSPARYPASALAVCLRAAANRAGNSGRPPDFAAAQLLASAAGAGPCAAPQNLHLSARASSLAGAGKWTRAAGSRRPLRDLVTAPPTGTGEGW